MKKLTIYFFAIVALLFLFKSGCSDINNSGMQDQVEGIKSVVPAQGPYGARVLIGGKGFTNTPEVLFNGIAAEVESASDSTILTRVPLEANTGPIEVIAGEEILTGPTFTIDSTRTLFLTIDEISPAQGRIRDTVRISGNGFSSTKTRSDSRSKNISFSNKDLEFSSKRSAPGVGATTKNNNVRPGVNTTSAVAEPKVYFNGIQAPVIDISDTQIIVTVPQEATSGLLTVISEPDTVIGPEFIILRHAISGISPESGAAGTEVTINGSDFSNQFSENSVFFNGLQAEILKSSSSQIITSVPFEATSGPVSVAVRRDTLEGPTFSVQELQILEVDPLSGEVGTDVLISGNGFSPNDEENTIEFNGVEAPVISASETELHTQVPEEASSGEITVTVNEVTVSGPEFTVEAKAPVIASVEPLSGAIGEQVAIKGSNFSANESEVSVQFNETEAEVLSSTEAEIQTRVPEGATSGAITVSINGKSVAGPEFEVITTGTLIVEISTSGSDIDPDGYVLTINAGDGIRTEVNDTITRSGLREGSYEILLDDIETNCNLTQDMPNPRTANVEAGSTTTVEYTISCEGINEPPIAAFTASCTNLTCDLDASESSDSDGSIASYDWILGDGSTTTGQLVSHSYETSGTYNVELTVTDDEGATNSVSQDVTVTVPEITEVSPLSGVPGSSVTISGANFSSVASENNVQFNGVRAELNSASETELSAIVPADATTGLITVTISDYTVTGPEFTVEELQEPKTLEVVVSTQGSMQDENGYTLSVTGQDDRIVKPNDNVMYSDIMENSVQVELTGVAENCMVDGENPRSVNLDNSDNAGFTEFTVTCSAPAPEITGIDPSSGPTGSEVVITGANFSGTASENIVEFNGERAELNNASESELIAVVPGTATSGPVTVTVNDQTATGPEFTVVQLGSIEVSTSTSGSDLDADGYTLSVEGLSDQPIGINETKLVDELPIGSYSVELTGIAENCQLNEELPNPRTVEVTENSTTSTNYDIFCSAINEPPVAVIESFCLGLDCGFTGTSSSDSDGEIVSYDWDLGDGSIASGDSVTHVYEAEGNYEVELIVTDDDGALDTTVQNVETVLPRITGIDPDTGPVGTEVTITGSGFSDIEGANSVGFTSGETIIAAEVISFSTTQLVATVPGDATTGPVYVAVAEDYVTEGPVFTVEQPIQPKTLEVSVSTEGVTQDGYTLSVTGQDARFVEPNGSTTYSNIMENEVSVELSGLGENCTLEGENPRTVNLDNSDNAGFTAFNISCPSPAPTIENIDPNTGGYGSSVIITGSNFSSLASENNVQFNGTRAELNSVSSTEIDAIVPWDASSGPVTVTVNGQTATGPEFTVIEPKTLQVVTNTSGSNIDENGYTMSVSNRPDSDIAVNDTLIYNEIFQNEVTVELTGIPENCTLEGSNPRTISLDNSDNAGFTAFNVSCSAPAPEINNISPTSGPTGTEVVITGTNFSPVASENNVQFNGTRAELNFVSETEIQTLVPINATTGPVTITVDGQTAEGPTFTVQEAKSLDVQIETGGSQVDPDGYTLSVTGAGEQPVNVNETVQFSEIYADEVEVVLSGVANNCRIDGENPRTVVLDNTDNAASTTFTIDCTIDLRGEIIFTTDRDGGSEIYRQNADASSINQITKTPDIIESSPAISPDGLKIVYSSNNNIFIMDSDGSDVSQITKDGYNSSPSWSPQGDQIVFERFVTSEVPDLYTMNIDGSDLKNITNTETIAERQPDWSPDGRLIVFVSFENRKPEIFTIRIDGSGRTQLTRDGIGDIEPEWSPKGERIAFVRNVIDVGNKVHIMNSDGSGIYALTPGTNTERSPSWSPDGSMMTYASMDDGIFNIHVYTVELNDIISRSFTRSNDQTPHWNYN